MTARFKVGDRVRLVQVTAAKDHGTVTEVNEAPTEEPDAQAAYTVTSDTGHTLALLEQDVAEPDEDEEPDKA